jgi:hypothetical protein
MIVHRNTSSPKDANSRSCGSRMLDSRIVFLIWHFLPAGEEIYRLLYVRIPNRFWGCSSVLQPAFSQPDHRRPISTIHEQLHTI